MIMMMIMMMRTIIIIIMIMMMVLTSIDLCATLIATTRGDPQVKKIHQK